MLLRYFGAAILALVGQGALCDARLEARVDTLFAAYTQPGSPGVAVGLFKGDSIVLAKGYGLADLESGTPITPQTRFHAASVAKQFTAFTAALLAREGKLDLDVDARRYLPYLPEAARGTTLTHLLQHTSGLRDQWALFAIGGKDARDVLSTEHVVRMISRQQDVNFTPGTRWIYNNTGFTLAGEAIRAVSGKSLRQVATERVFAPLGMNRTLLLDDVTEVVPGRANSYEKAADGRWHRSLLNYDTVGATSLVTTIEDLARWSANFSNPRVGDRALIDLVTRPGALNDSTPLPYGLGLYVQAWGGHVGIGHDGSDAGFRAAFAYFPEHDAGIALLANTDLDAEETLARLAELYFPATDHPSCGERRPGADSASVCSRAFPSSVKSPTLQPIPAGLLAELPGTYLYSVRPAVTILRTRDQLLGQIGTAEPQPLLLRSDGAFDFGSPALLKYRIVSDATGAVRAIDRIAANARPDERMDKVVPIAGSLAVFAGDYRSDELDITYTFAVENGALTARTLWRSEPIRLTQRTATHFDTDSWAPAAVTFVRKGDAAPTAVRFHTSRAFNVVLRRIEPTKTSRQ